MKRLSNNIVTDKRLVKLEAVEITSLSDLSDEIINIIIKKQKKILQNKINKKNIKKIDVTSVRYLTLLKLTNRFLVAINKSPIDKLTDFCMIDRQDIIKCDNTILNNMSKELFKRGVFKKPQSWFRKGVPSYNLNVLRSLVKGVGLKLVKIQKNKYSNEDGKPCVRTCTYYSVKNI